MIAKQMILAGGKVYRDSSGLKRFALEFGLMLVCCVAGVLVKKAINPAANMITDFLHIPGGISTAVSLMFLVIGAGMTKGRFNAGIMGMTQGFAALSVGMVGSMGFLLPVAYVVPGAAIDLAMLLPLPQEWGRRVKAFLANIAGSVAAALFADIAVFHLPSLALTVYICVAALSGAVCGYVAGSILAGMEKISANRED